MPFLKKRTIEAVMSRSKICNTFLQNKIEENRKCKTNKFPVPLLQEKSKGQYEDYK